LCILPCISRGVPPIGSSYREEEEEEEEEEKEEEEEEVDCLPVKRLQVLLK
jgi:hypothetical protein